MSLSGAQRERRCEAVSSGRLTQGEEAVGNAKYFKKNICENVKISKDD